MPLPNNIIANADDLGLNNSVNKAILYCFEKLLINSTSFITNTLYFEETIKLVNENPCIINIGVHINFAEGKPLTNAINYPYVDMNGNWDLDKTNKKLGLLNNRDNLGFEKEIAAQIEKALSAGILIVHLDSHYHLHTLPCFYQLFLQAAKKYKLKLRLAQTYNEGNYIKFLYRQWINNQIKKNDVNYSGRFENVYEFISKKHNPDASEITEVMVHPDFDLTGKLIDHYQKDTIKDWAAFLDKPTT